MKTLFYIEPVVFRNKPDFLLPHVRWVRQLITSNGNAGLDYGFASSGNLCGQLMRLLPNSPAVTYFALDQWKLLEPFEFKRMDYSRSLYGRTSARDGGSGTQEHSSLVENLRAIKKSFHPDVVVCSSQNSAIESVFRDSLHLFYEQAPLPRMHGKLNMFLDPLGHQVNSFLNSCLAEILALSLPSETQRETLATWEDRTRAPDDERETMLALHGLVQELKRGRKIVVFAMQPPDWLSYEGALEDISPDALLAKWARSLPEGWVGIPTFHRDSRFPVELEKSIKDAFPNIEFLPESLSQNTTQHLLHVVDGLITISSTAAMTACLRGIPAIVTGACPFSTLLGGRVEDLGQIEPRSVSERAALIAFLTHRYCHEGARFFGEKNYFLSLAQGMHAAKNVASDLLDFGEWSPSSIRRFF